MDASTGKKDKKSRKKGTPRAKLLKNLKKANKARQKKFAWMRMKYREGRLKGMNRYRAALFAGYSESVARHACSKLDRFARLGIITCLENEGATDRIIAKELVRIALTATKRIPCTVEIRDDEEGEVIIDKDAKEVVPDEHLRKETLELIAKLKGHIKPPSLIPTDGGFKRLVVVVEREPDAGSDNRPGDTPNAAAKSRVALTD